MYIIIWPEERLVLRRIIRVKGRISWEKISTRGRKSINPTGEPYGNMWDMNSFICVTETQIIKGTQNNKLTVKVKL
jgi:hypothetical protein